MVNALASHYAHALADAVFASNSGLAPEEAVKQMSAGEELISGSEELSNALLSPAITKDRKAAVISRLSDELGLHRLIRNFLLVVISHRRTKDLAGICQEFAAEVDKRLGWLPADIASAQELSPQQKEEVERTLGVKLGKMIRANYRVDPNLLAGVRARVASKEYDASLRGKLEGMRQKLTAGL
jgi:F-type H+-transporting ATPase subunit delta